VVDGEAERAPPEHHLEDLSGLTRGGEVPSALCAVNRSRLTFSDGRRGCLATPLRLVLPRYAEHVAAGSTSEAQNTVWARWGGEFVFRYLVHLHYMASLTLCEQPGRLTDRNPGF
jgi:hypothetical protein